VPAAPRAGFGVQELRPGASLAVGLASGDLTASAVGTVSYVDGDRVWGFAHPLDAVGRRSLLLQDAYVYTVISNPLGTEDGSSYKLAAPGHDLGTLTGDGLSAVVGRLGPLPARFPLRINARDEDTGRIEVMNVQLADETEVGTPTGTSALSAVGPVALAQAAYTVLGGAPMRQSGSMCVRIELRERRSPMRFCNTYVGGGGGSAELAGAPLVADFGTAIELLDAYDVAPLHVTKVEANVKLRRGLRQAFLVGVRGPSVVRRGTTVRLRVRLRRVRGGFSTRAIRVRIPRGMPAGERELTLTGTASDQVAGGEDGTIDISDLFDLGGGGALEGQGPTSVDELAGLIAGIGRYDGVTASFREPGGGGLDEEQGGELPGGAEGVALRERPVLRDPELRVSGSVALPVTVR